MKSLPHNLIKIILPFCGILLLILHGFESSVGFKIDTISALLLITAFIPFLGSFLHKAKAGDIELSFIQPTTSRSLLNSLKALSDVRLLTYYKPRDREGGLTQAHIAIVEFLMKDYKDDIYKEIKVWLANGSDNVKWMASEIIGYHGISDLGDKLLSLYQGKNYNEQWPEWQLNCMWAHSKVSNNFLEMHQFLRTTENLFNQEWLLGAYEQMVLKGQCDVAIFKDEVSSFLLKLSLSENTKKKALCVLETINQHFK